MSNDEFESEGNRSADHELDEGRLVGGNAVAVTVSAHDDDLQREGKGEGGRPGPTSLYSDSREWRCVWNALGRSMAEKIARVTSGECGLDARRRTERRHVRQTDSQAGVEPRSTCSCHRAWQWLQRAGLARAVHQTARHAAPHITTSQSSKRARRLSSRIRPLHPGLHSHACTLRLHCATASRCSFHTSHCKEHFAPSDFLDRARD